jgi:predicted AlkP superfamily pyrophosphatase or phosphodiesterase
MGRLYDLVPVLTSAARLTLALLLAAQFPLAQTQTGLPSRSVRPKLVVLLSIDQMRGDYVDHYGHQWSKGLKRLITEGAWFRQADYPYYTTVTCPGHASISTGTVPAVHGMVENQWWDRATARLTSCTSDDTAQLITYGNPVKGGGHSARRLMTTAFADELRLQGAVAPRVVSISLKARSAITLGGHKPDAVIWLDEADGEWVTSTAFAKAPVQYFSDYINRHPLREEMGRKWDRSLPLDQYVGEYSAENRRRYALVTKEFPHVVKGRGDEVGGAFTDAWESSPYSDAYLAALGNAALDTLKLGRGRGTDLLAISYSALDKTGHDFGPDSHEVQDVLIHLDAQIGALLDKLDREVGKGNYVVALSSDHGVAPVPERMKAQGFDAGRVNTTAIGRAIDDILQRDIGQGTYRTRVQYNDIFFDAGVYEKLSQNARAMAAVLDVIRMADGIASVHRKEDLSRVDPLTRPLALSYYEGRSGDLKIVVRPYWIASPSTSTHGTGHRYDSRVPVVLFGYGIKKGEYLEPASPIDIAPTLALLTGVTLPNPSGRVLTEALTSPR